MRPTISHGVLRVVALVVAGATALLIAVGAIEEDFLAPDVGLIVALVTGSAVRASPRARAWLLAALSATVGVFAVSVWQSVVADDPNWRTGVGVLVCLGVVVLMVRGEEAGARSDAPGTT